MRKRKRSLERFARLPRRVLESKAVTSLPHAAFRVLVAYAAQYHGFNNGSLGLTRKQAKAFGITSHQTLQRSQRILVQRGLIRLTRQGTRTPPVPNFYAVTWEGIDPGKHDARENPVPTREFETWSPLHESDFDARSSGTADARSSGTESPKTPVALPAHRARSAVSDARSSGTSKTSATGRDPSHTPNRDPGPSAGTIRDRLRIIMGSAPPERADGGPRRIAAASSVEDK